MEEKEVLSKVIEGAKTPQEVVKILLDKNLISTTALRDLDVYYTYQENLRSCGRFMHAYYDTAIQKGVSEMTVRRARRKFEE